MACKTMNLTKKFWRQGNESQNNIRNNEIMKLCTQSNQEIRSMLLILQFLQFLRTKHAPAFEKEYPRRATQDTVLKQRLGCLCPLLQSANLPPRPTRYICKEWWQIDSSTLNHDSVPGWAALLNHRVVCYFWGMWLSNEEVSRWMLFTSLNVGVSLH